MTVVGILLKIWSPCCQGIENCRILKMCRMVCGRLIRLLLGQGSWVIVRNPLWDCGAFSGEIASSLSFIGLPSSEKHTEEGVVPARWKCLWLKGASDGINSVSAYDEFLINSFAKRTRWSWRPHIFGLPISRLYHQCSPVRSAKEMPAKEGCPARIQSSKMVATGECSRQNASVMWRIRILLFSHPFYPEAVMQPMLPPHPTGF